MDRITERMVESFKTSFGLDSISDTELFEYFANYCIVNQEYGKTSFDLDAISTGEAAQGIDGIAILVNQKLIDSTDDIDLLIEMNQTMSVKFVFIQTKTSESFSNSLILNFLHFVKVFFSEGPTPFTTDQMAKFIELKNYIFEHGEKLKKNPELHMYYVSQGIWDSKNDTLSSVVNSNVQELNSMQLFSNIEFYPIDASKLQDLYRTTNRCLSATFKFEKRVTMYTSGDEEVGYSGVIPFSEYKKLLLEENGAIKSVFDDNIRDYLGPNLAVNRSIQESIDNNDPNAFCMLNNGITVVATSMSILGDRVTIEDYQIVNGCQTSHVLIDSVEDGKNLDNLLIPIRIIATKNEELKNRITRATNNQTSIKTEQLEALSTFQKNLEEYYNTFTESDALKYERRTGQYRGKNINKSRIVTIPTQIKAVAAMFLNDPNQVSGQYGTVARRIGDKIFRSTDRLVLYYTSALTLYKIDSLIRLNVIERSMKRARYHIMMLFREAVSKDPMPAFHTKKMDNYCKYLLRHMKDEKEFEDTISIIVNVIKKYSSEIDIDNRKCFEKKETTTFLYSKINEIKLSLKDAGIICS